MSPDESLRGVPAGPARGAPSPDVEGILRHAGDASLAESSRIADSSDGGGFRRPTPVIGDASSARERRDDPAGWSMGAQVQEALADVIGARRDIRRYRPDAVPDELVREVLAAGHAGPSVGHSQPWRFIVVSDPATRDRAAHLADTARLRQARQMLPERAARLLDLKLEGLREAPVGVVVACDRRVPAAGVLGRATFTDTDVWSCACAIENMWLTARAHGLGMGWVTLFEPADLADLLGLPDGVETLGWMCLGWPDERPPEPGLQRSAWSAKLALDDVVLAERWPETGEIDATARGPETVGVDGGPTAFGSGAPASGLRPTGPPPSYLAGPEGARLVVASDDADRLLAPPEALGVLDRVVNRVAAIAGPDVAGGTLVLAGADHPVTRHGVSAYASSVTVDVMRAARAGTSLGAAHARSAGLACLVVDAGVDGRQPAPASGADELPAGVPTERVDLVGPRGDLVDADALTPHDVEACLAAGRRLGARAGASGLVVLGEVGVGNTTIAAALAAALLEAPSDAVLGLGSGADAAMMARKKRVVEAALERSQGSRDVATNRGERARLALTQVGGPEVAVLAGVVLGAAEAHAPIVLDGLATSVAALAAARMEPSVQAYLVAGQRSRESAHGLVLDELGLEPLLDLRLRAGEGVGACLAAGMILQALDARRASVRTTDAGGVLGDGDAAGDS